MKQLFSLFVILVSTTCSLTSCGTIADMMVEDTLQQAFEGKSIDGKSAKENSHAHSTKALDKKREQYIKEGKCPDCFGIGKSPDGKYTCVTCNGTGKYTTK